MILVAATRLAPKRSVHFSSDSRSENTLLPFPTHDNHGPQGSIMLVLLTIDIQLSIEYHHPEIA